MDRGACRLQSMGLRRVGHDWAANTFTLENSVEVPQNTKNRATIWSCNPTPGHIPGENNSKKYMHPSVHCSTYNSQDIEGTSMSVNRWMDKEDEVYIYTLEYYSAIKKNEIMPFAATWMDLKIILQSEISQTKTNIIQYHVYVKSKKNDTNELIYKRETDSQM